jgi:hypothetical protein
MDGLTGMEGLLQAVIAPEGLLYSRPASHQLRPL